MKHRFDILWEILVLLLLGCFITSLVQCTPGTRYTLHEDNDIFKPTINNDSDFSQGLRITADVPDSSGTTSYFFGNNFYTPDNKQLTKYQPDKRPYAGYTYAGGKLNYRKSETLKDSFGITLGTTGRWSYSEQFQNQVHRWLDQQTAKGWDNQVPNEIGIILEAERKYAVTITNTLDNINSLGMDLGNVFTQAYAGSQLRYGYNLPDYFGDAEPIFPRVPNGTSFPKEESKWSYYLYGGPYVRGVLRNIFLDGAMFRDSPSIDKYPIVGEMRLGFAVEYGLYRFAYTYIAQSKEYHGQEPNSDFGEITITIGVE